MLNQERMARMSTVKPEPEEPVEKRNNPSVLPDRPEVVDDPPKTWEETVGHLDSLLGQKAIERAEDAPGYDRLTAREREAMGHLAMGMTNAEAAKVMDISVKTVDTHRYHLIDKLGLRNNSDLTWYCIRYGLVPLRRPEVERRMNRVHSRED